MLARNVDQALPALEGRARARVALFAPPVNYVRTWYFLDEERAAKGDTAGACAAYDKLLEHWGNARPRSLTAGKTRAEESPWVQVMPEAVGYA